MKYRSKFHSTTKEQFNAGKSLIPKTIGQTVRNSPQDFLKKRTRETKAEPNKSIMCLCRKRTGKEDRTIKGLISPPISVDEGKRNFVQENALQTVKRPPTAPKRRVIDSNKGNSVDPEESGMVKKYCNKSGYGRTPKYIGEIRKNFVFSRQKFAKLMQTRSGSDEIQVLSSEAKEEILEGLVKNLKELLRRYLSVMNADTPKNIRRKEEMEERIDALQRDIDLLERNKEILIRVKSSPSSLSSTGDIFY